MFRTLFKRTPMQAPVQPPLIPPGLVVWAVGDVHGRLDLLDVLLDGITADVGKTGRRTMVVFLGDYVDRGPDSRGVIDRLCSFADDSSIEARFLRGNHEQKLVEFLADPAVGPVWCEYGGAQALQSFGLNVPVVSHQTTAWAALSADLGHRLTDRQRRFLDELETSLSIGGYFFAHAGARPGIALEDQSERDLMWVRGSFLNSSERFERVVVHGHTPASSVHMDDRRIGLDTGAYASGVLSAVRLEDGGRTVFQAVQLEDGAITLRGSSPTPPPLPDPPASTYPRSSRRALPRSSSESAA